MALVTVPALDHPLPEVPVVEAVMTYLTVALVHAIRVGDIVALSLPVVVMVGMPVAISGALQKSVVQFHLVFV